VDIFAWNMIGILCYSKLFTKNDGFTEFLPLDLTFEKIVIQMVQKKI